MAGRDREQSSSESSVRRIEEARARRANRAARRLLAPEPSPTTPPPAAGLTDVAKAADRRPGRVMADTIANEQSPDVGAVLDGVGGGPVPELTEPALSSVQRRVSQDAVDVDLAASGEAGVSEPADLDEIVARLEVDQSVTPAVGEPVIPRGSADLGAGTRTVRRDRTRIGARRSQSTGRAGRRLLVLVLLGTAILVAAVVLGVSHRGRTVRVSHLAKASVAQGAVSARSPTEIPDLDLGHVSAEIDSEISRVAGSVPHNRPAQKRRRQVKHVAKRTSEPTHAAATVAASSDPPAASSSQPVSLATTPSSGEAASAGSSTKSHSSSSSSSGSDKSSGSSRQSLGSLLGGIQGKQCNPVCR